MARTKKNGRVYWRNGRAYGDFRDLGGKRERLVPKGESLATDDPDVAAKLASERVKQLTEEKKSRALGITPETEGATLKAYAATHLRKKATEPRKMGSPPVTTVWLSQAQKHLQAAVDFFGAARDLRTIDTADLDGWVEHLRTQDNGRGGTYSETTVLKHLNSLSNLFKRAIAEKKVTGVATNPCREMFSKPSGTNDEEPEYLRAHEAALLLEAARTYRAPTGLVRQGHGGAISPDAYPHMFALLATFLLTGCRKAEVLGLEVDDISFRLKKIFLKPNQWRRLKTKKSKREIPLHPQLEAILREYMAERERTGGLGRLLFPSGRGEREMMISDLRKALDTIGVRAGFPSGYIRLHMLRHTYTAARLQTLDHGRPIAPFTVARELGHSSEDMITDRYGHLHDRLPAGDPEVVEFRVEHHREALKAKLAAMPGEE